MTFGCATDPSELHSHDVDAIQPLIRAQWDAFIEAWEQNDAAGCAAFYTEDARHIPPNSDINVGRDAIAAFYETLFLDHISSDYSHTIRSLFVCHELAIEEGQFQVEWTRDDSTTWSFAARSHAHWVLEDEEWKIQTFIFNLPKR